MRYLIGLLINLGHHRCLCKALFFTCSLLLAACAGNQTTPPVATMSLSSIQQAITQAESLDTITRQQRFIDLATELQRLGETENAIALLERINSADVTDQQYPAYLTLASSLYTTTQSIFKSYNLLTNERVQRQWDQLSVSQQILLSQHKAALFSQLGNAEASIKERIALDAILSDPLDITENHDALWQELATLSLDTLTRLENTASDFISIGWYQLAVISKTYETNLSTKQNAVSNWISANPSHPASLELPLDLQLLNTLIEERPKQLALLLPLQGKLAAAGKTIRDGFFAAYYTNQNADFVPEVRVYDTSQEPINSIYDQAVNEGADLIIGPLEKEKLLELQLRVQLPVTTLALNYSNDDPDAPKTNTLPLYQFGLSLEDEAIQAADRAWLEGHRYAMVLASSADWSNRAANAFIKHWQQRGGRVVVNQAFSDADTYSNTIKSALAINESENRARNLKRLFGKNFEFEPRRRQDIDMIFLVASSGEGQQIKPTLSFHYAGNIPVYATSQIYSSAQTASKNRDLNGIRFTTLPWTLEPNNPEKQLISQYLKIPPNYERLYALGVDTFFLHDRIKQLARLPNTSIYGTTGKLHLGSNQRVMREQPWAEIVNGEAKALPYLSLEDQNK
jgi:outer membrane PBP1 activator LpoA protein